MNEAKAPETAHRLGLDWESLLSGSFGAFCWLASGLVVPESRILLQETGLTFPPLTELILGVPGWGWPALAVVSLSLVFKDRWVAGAGARSLNTLHLVLVLVAVGLVSRGLFPPFVLMEVL